MNSIVFYYSRKDSAIQADQTVRAAIRGELHEGKTLDEALDAAKPMEGEVVLNSVEAPE